jgi:hypothetical protein
MTEYDAAVKQSDSPGMKSLSLGKKGEVYIGGPKYREITSQDPAGAAQLISDAEYAVNANFYFGGFSGSRFNWVGGW